MANTDGNLFPATATSPTSDEPGDWFHNSSLMTALGRAGQLIGQQGGEATQNRALRMQSLLNTGVHAIGDDAGASSNRATPGKAAATEDPAEVEARWMARLQKYGGIAQSTGVKLGGA